jgi:hypothetical protein
MKNIYFRILILTIIILTSNAIFCADKTPRELLDADKDRASFSVKNDQHRINGIKISKDLYLRTSQLHQADIYAKRSTNIDQDNMHDLALLLPHIVTYLLTNSD